MEDLLTNDVDAALILYDVRHACVASRSLSGSRRYGMFTQCLRQCKRDLLSGASAAAKRLGALPEIVKCAIYFDASTARTILIATVLCAASLAETACTRIQGEDGCSSAGDARTMLPCGGAVPSSRPHLREARGAMGANAGLDATQRYACDAEG